MNDTENQKVYIFGAAIMAGLLIVVIDGLTNSLDNQKCLWDSCYYIAMAQNGFNSHLASPFAYRYVTPLLVYLLTHTLGVSLANGFRSIAYLGAFFQLTGVFIFTKWFTHSIKGAYVALTITAFSLFNVKFLLFDIYRPDHLAYAFILLQSYFAMERKFIPLLITTLIASQIREFNIIPLVAYLFAFAPGKDRRTLLKEFGFSLLGLFVAIILPRLLISVAENFQFADLSADGILRVLISPLILSRDANFLYSLAAYFLPILMIAGIEDFKSILRSFSSNTRFFLMTYISLVLLFSFIGGTDFYRFSTYLFLPQAILLGYLSQRCNNWLIAVMIAATFVFNRLWLAFPISDVGAYLDFYGAFATRFNWASALRIAECLLFIIIGYLVRRRLSLHNFKNNLQPE